MRRRLHGATNILQGGGGGRELATNLRGATFAATREIRERRTFLTHSSPFLTHSSPLSNVLQHRFMRIGLVTV